MTRAQRAGAAALAVVAAVGAFAFRGPILARFRTTPEQRALEEKVNSSRRTLTYPVTFDRPLTIGLLPHDKEVKILSNLEVEESAIEAARDGPAMGGGRPDGASEVEFVYGLRIAYLDVAGRTIQATDYWERTRKTRVRDPGALVDREEAFFREGATTPCDTRATYVLVRDAVARGATALRISFARPAPEAGTAPDAAGAAGARRVLVRCLRSVELTRDEAIARWARLREDEREEALREVNLYKADLVSEAERIDLMRRQWQVIPALPHQGIESPTVPVYFTSFFETYEPPRDEFVHAAAASPVRALALNLVGPTNLWIEVFRDPVAPGARPPGGGGAPVLELIELREEGVADDRRERIEAAPGGESRTPILLSIREGPATIVCRPLNFDAHVRFHVDRLNSLEGSEVTRVVSPLGSGGPSGAPGWLEVRPEVLSASYYDLRGSEAPGALPLFVEAEVVHPRPRLGVEPGAGEATEVRIAARAPIELEDARAALATDPFAEGGPGGGAQRGAPRPFSFEVEMLAADGSTIGRRTLVGLAEPSLFDGYWREIEQRTLVSEPEFFTIRCPPAVRRLRLRSRERVDVAFYSRLPTAEDWTYVPEDYPKTPEIRVSEVVSGRLRPKTWFYYRPANQHELALAGREVRIEVQRQFFERRERARELYEISNFARALEPLAPERRASVLEPGSVEGGRLVVARPNARFLVRTAADETLVLADTIDPEATRPLPIVLRYAPRAPVAAAPARESFALVYVDGARAFEGPLAPEGGEVTLGAYPQGDRRVRVEVYSRADAAAAFELDADPRFAFFADFPVRAADGGRLRLDALHFEREVFALGAEGLDFDVEKTGREPVALNCVLFAPRAEGAAAGARDHIAVEIAEVRGAPDGAATLVPVETRRFNVKRPADGAAYLRERDGGRSTAVGRGERFFVSLKTELDPGRYRVTMRRGAPIAGTGASADDPLFVRVAAVDPARARISRTSFARLNVKGPLRLKVVLDPAEGPSGATDVRLLAKVVPGGALEERIVRLAAGVEPSATIDVPAGLRTVIVGTLAAPRTARFFIDRPVDALAGILGLAVPDDVRNRPWLEVVPDVVEESVHVARAGEPGIEYPVASAAAAALPVRIETAIPLAEPSEVEPAPYGYEVAFLDAAGAVVSAVAVDALAQFARTARDTATGAAVSEIETAHIVPPPGAERLRIASLAGDVYVAVGQETPAPAHVFTPEDYAGERGIRRSDFARVEGRFEVLDPLGARGLADRGRRRTIARAQARVREVVEPPPADGFAEALVPLDYAGRRRVLEPAPLEAAADPQAAGSLFVPVRGGERGRFAVVDPLAPTATAATLPVDVPVYFTMGGPVPREEVVATVDDERALATLLVTPNGRLEIPGVLPGAREIGFQAPPTAVFWVGAPPAEPASAPALLRERVLTRIEAARPLEVEVEKREGRDLLLNGALYLAGPPSSGAYLEVAVAAEGRRRTGVPAAEITRPVHRYHLGRTKPVAVVDLDRFANAPAHVYPFYVPLKADLPDGVYRARVVLVGAPAGEVRFLVLRTRAPIVERARAAALRRD